MRSSMIIGAIMAIGCAAVPLEKKAIDVVEVVDVVTVTLSSGQSPPSSTPAPPPAKTPATTPAEASATGGGFLEHSTPSAVPAPAPAPSTSSSGSSGGSSTSDDQAGILQVVNKWRAAYSLNELTWNHELDGNVQQTGAMNGGVNENHELMSGVAMGQVITPGQSVTFPVGATKFSPFEIAYVAWLCEVDTDPELGPGANGGIAMCPLVNSILHMDYEGKTGHHDILVSPSYTGISCGFTANPASGPTEVYQGIWICDLSQ